MTGPETQHQTEQVEGHNRERYEKTSQEIKEIEWYKNSNNVDEINKKMYEKWREIMESIPSGKEWLQKAEELFDKIKTDANYLTLSNINEIKVYLFWVNPINVILAVRKSGNTDTERTKQVIKALKEPWESVNENWSESIQELQKIMGKTLGIKLNPDWKFWKETFNAMERYLSGETVTAKNANEANNTRVNASDVMFGNEKLPIQNEDGKNFVEIDWKKYYEYKKGMNWLWYENGINKNGIEYTYIWNFVNGYWEWNWTITRANGDKYEWEFKNNEFEWKWTATRADGDKYEWEWKNGNREWFWTFTRANGNKYEWEWKEGHTEWRWTRTWANWKSVEWAFVKTDGTEYGLATPAKFIDNSGEYEVIRDNELLKVTSEWEYKDRYIDPNNWDFVDAPSSNWFNNQVDDQTGNNIDNKKAQEISSYEDLLNELKGIWNKTLVYKFDDNTVFTFTKGGCKLEVQGKIINFEKKSGFYVTQSHNVFVRMRDNFIDVTNFGEYKRFYKNWNKFEWFIDSIWLWNPKEWIMTYSDWSKFEWKFIVEDWKLKRWEEYKVNLNENFWS